MSKLWGGRFKSELDACFAQFNQSLPFDRRLVHEDIEGSLAYAQAIHAAGVLSAEEWQAIDAGLHSLKSELDQDETPLDQAIAAGIEDVHSFVESELFKRIGAPAHKLHTGRSRNEQVSLDLRLYLKKQIHRTDHLLAILIKTSIDQAERYAEAPLPGYTHLQRAQPVTWGHYFLSWTEMLRRDRDRLKDCLKRIDYSPLGCGSLSGNPWPIDPEALATRLGMQAPCANSIDATSDRDFVIDYISAASIAMMHLSRLSEDLIIYASQEFDFLSLSDSVCTGSSLMPQKKNPDALELIRGKSGRTFGNLTAILTLMKGLPSAYNKDLQEDKEILFDVIDTWQLCLRVMNTVLEGLEPNTERTRVACQGGYLNATEFADYLCRQGMPFRQAHEVVGKTVNYAIEQGKQIEQLSLEELKRFAPSIEASVYDCLKVEQALAARKLANGTAATAVRRRVAHLRHEWQADANH